MTNEEFPIHCKECGRGRDEVPMMARMTDVYVCVWCIYTLSGIANNWIRVKYEESVGADDGLGDDFERAKEALGDTEDELDRLREGLEKLAQRLDESDSAGSCCAATRIRELLEGDK